jgi:hypothetical protein
VFLLDGAAWSSRPLGHGRRPSKHTATRALCPTHVVDAVRQIAGQSSLRRPDIPSSRAIAAASRGF